MKKRIRLVGIGLLLVSVALLSCAPAQKTVITNDNLSALKGAWEGWTSFSAASVRPVLTKLEIYNTTIPLTGMITVYNIPDPIANVMPAHALPAGNNVTIDFKDGKITDQGTIIGQGQAGNFLELTLYGGEKMKMSGWFYYYGVKGTMDLTKK